jgi:hypothetical protein
LNLDRHMGRRRGAAPGYSKSGPVQHVESQEYGRKNYQVHTESAKNLESGLVVPVGAGKI